MLEGRGRFSATPPPPPLSLGVMFGRPLLPQNTHPGTYSASRCRGAMGFYGVPRRSHRGKRKPLTPGPGGNGVKQSPTAPLSDRQHRAPGGERGLQGQGGAGGRRVSHCPYPAPTGRTGMGMLPRQTNRQTKSLGKRKKTLHTPSRLTQCNQPCLNGEFGGFISWCLFFFTVVIFVFYSDAVLCRSSLSAPG